jgi:ribonuclease P protein component
MARPFSLSKNEKLKSRKQIDDLFATGKSVSVFPVRVSYKFSPAMEEESILQIGVTASRRNFKRAVDRNRAKRLLREAYRLQKTALVQLMNERKLKGYAFFMYTDKQKPNYTPIFEAMTKCLELLQRKAAQYENPS